MRVTDDEARVIGLETTKPPNFLKTLFHLVHSLTARGCLIIIVFLLSRLSYSHGCLTETPNLPTVQMHPEQ